MIDLPDKELLRPDEVAAYLRLSVKSIYGRISQGKIDAVRIEPFGVLRIRRETVLKMIQPANQ